VFEDLHELQFIHTVDLYHNKLKINDIIQLISLTSLKELDVSKNLFPLYEMPNERTIDEYMKLEKALRSKLIDRNIRVHLKDWTPYIEEYSEDYYTDIDYDSDSTHPQIKHYNDSLTSDSNENSNEYNYLRIQSKEETISKRQELICKKNVFKETGFALSGTFPTEPSVCSEAFQDSEWDSNESNYNSEWEFRNEYGTFDPEPSINYDFDRLHEHLDLGPNTLIPSDIHAKNSKTFYRSYSSNVFEMSEELFEDAD